MNKIIFRFVFLSVLLVFGIVPAQTTKTIDLNGNNDLIITILSEQIIIDSDSLNNKIEIPIELVNRTDNEITIEYCTNEVPGQLLINYHNEFAMLPGFSVGIYNVKDSTEVEYNVTSSFPIDDELLELYGLPKYKNGIVDSAKTNHQRANHLKSNSTNKSNFYTKKDEAVKFLISSNQRSNHIISFYLKQDYANTHMAYELEQNNEYYFKLFFNAREQFGKISNNKIDCSVSNTIKLIVK